MSEPTLCSIYRLRVVLNGVSPLVWCRLLVSSETNLADLHDILQLAFGWSGLYLYEFRIHGRTFGEERSVCLADLQLHPGERFRYGYNFFVFWECDVRLEAILPHQGELTHPRCLILQAPCNVPKITCFHLVRKNDRFCSHSALILEVLPSKGPISARLIGGLNARPLCLVF